MIRYEKLILGELATNCYLVWEEKSKEAVIIDPADDGVGISEEIMVRQLVPVAIMATHGHFDHVLGALDLRLMYNIPFCCSSKDMFLLERQNKTASHFLNKSVKVPNFRKIDIDLDEIKEIKIGDESLVIIKTPGHTPGGVCIYNRNSKLLFSGDTIFYHTHGETNHSYGSAKEIYKSIQEILKLEEETEILPGHGQETSVANEKEFYL